MSSRFYVLHDWEHTYSQDKTTAPLPAVEISDIMLKTMGILKVWEYGEGQCHSLFVRTDYGGSTTDPDS